MNHVHDKVRAKRDMGNHYTLGCDYEIIYCDYVADYYKVTCNPGLSTSYLIFIGPEVDNLFTNETKTLRNSGSFQIWRGSPGLVTIPNNIWGQPTSHASLSNKEVKVTDNPKQSIVVEKHKCTCPMRDLMMNGCKCGGI